jgi:hypothetical protein
MFRSSKWGLIIDSVVGLNFCRVRITPNSLNSLASLFILVDRSIRLLLQTKLSFSSSRYFRIRSPPSMYFQIIEVIFFLYHIGIVFSHQDVIKSQYNYSHLKTSILLTTKLGKRNVLDIVDEPNQWSLS